MSVYERENAAHLAASLESLLQQTRLADEIVLVRDGPLTSDLDAVIEQFQKQLSESLKVVSLPRNQGLPAALNAGLKQACGDVIVRMDSDDVCHPHRFATQLDFMERHPEITVLGSAMFEFTEDPGDSTRIKRVVSEHDDILRQMIFRNPMNHPTVCFRVPAVNDAGGYPDLPFVEDYLLWVNLAASGARFHNLTEPLLYQRFDMNTIRRRGGWTNFKNELTVRKSLYQAGLSGAAKTVVAMSMQLVLRLLPASLRFKIWHMSRDEYHESDR